MKRVKVQVEKLTEHMQREEKVWFPSQPEQAKAIIALYNGEIQVALKKGVDKNDKTMEPPKGILGVSSNPHMLHKSLDPYRPPIPFPKYLKETT